MNAKWLIGIFVGAFLVYVGVMGATGFGFALRFAVKTTGFTDNFDDGTLASVWTKVANYPTHANALEQNGRLEISEADVSDSWHAEIRTTDQYDFSVDGAYVQTDVGWSGNGAVVLEVSIDNWYISPTTPIQNAYRMYVLKTASSSRLYVTRYSGGTGSSLLPSPSYVNVVEPQAFQIKFSGGSIFFNYKTAGTWIVATQDTYALSSKQLYVWLAGHADTGTSSYGVQYFDNFVLSIGGGGQPTTGTISLKAYYEPDYVAATLTITKPDGSTITTVTPYTNTVAQFGTWSITATYSSQTLFHSFTLSASHLDESYTFSFAGDAPPETPDIPKMIKDFLNNTVVKTIFTMSGVGTILGSAVMMFASVRKKTPSYSYLQS